MPRVKCKICEKGFYVRPYWIKHGWGKYCSKACQNESQKKGIWVACFVCKKEVYRTKTDIRKSKSKKYFCTKSCQTIWRNSIIYIGKRHPNWSGGESTYKSVMIRNGVAKLCHRCRISDSRILIVHHLDHNRKNNEITNLVWPCCNCHFLIHHDIKEREKFMAAMV